LILHNTEALSFVLFVLTFVCVSVWPTILTFSMLLIVFPLPFITFAVITHHCPLSFKSIRQENSLEYAALLHQNPFPMPPIIKELSIIAALVWIQGLSFPIWQVILPLSFISVAWPVRIFAIAISHIVFEVTFVITAILFYVSSTTLTSSIYELTFQIVPIFKLDRAKAFGFSCFSFSKVIGFETLKINFLTLMIIPLFELRNIRKLWQSRFNIVTQIFLASFDEIGSTMEKARRSHLPIMIKFLERIERHDLWRILMIELGLLVVHFSLYACLSHFDVNSKL